jgi:DNA polymerase III subunit alpha
MPSAECKTMSTQTSDGEVKVEEKKKSPFVHLHVHSMYSLSDALSSPKQIVAKAKELGYDAIALTDHRSLYGAIDLYQACEKEGMKPIIGVEAEIAIDSLNDRRPRIDERTNHLTILVENFTGYQNLLKLVSMAYLEGFYYKARMDKTVLKENHEGLIALSGCLKGEIPMACNEGDFEKAKKALAVYQDVFGKENFFLELVYHPDSPTQIHVNHNIIKLAEMTGAPLVATRDSHYLETDDVDAQDALQCIHAGKLLSDTNRYSIKTMDHSLTSPEEMVEAFKDTPEAITNTRKIADRVNLKIELGVNLLPTFPVPEGETEMSYLKKITLDGVKERYGDPLTDEIIERMEYELSVIENMGFPGYFLIVNEYVVWAKANDVIVGPGRGSAAGSIVAYALQITNLDPLKYGLLFERFLNPDRISMPDVDLDFDDVKRKDVIQYVTEKYGADRVAGIITFGTMAARAAVRDVGRVLGWTFQEVDRVAKVIPPPVQGKNLPIAVSRKENPELKSLDQSDPKVTQLLDLASKLEGTARHASQHACGIVIAPRPLHEFAPLQKAQGGDVEQVIQYSLKPAEAVGLLKMDFLGLSNLTVIREALEIIDAVHGDTIVMDDIPLDDAKTYELLGRAETTGVFQLESDGMKRYIRELKPTVIDDIIAMVALYRPGPMQFIDSFIARKHGKEKVKYIHPLTESALAQTYGIPVYQEQVMQVSKDMAGFTGGEADTLRKAMGKKIVELMVKMRAKFISGSVANGVPQDKAEKVFTQFEEFAAYGFNKSHAACYAYIAYQTAFLKAHYPEAFMAALLNSDCLNLDRVTIEVEECRRMGIEVLAPDVNESFAGFSVVKDTVQPSPERDDGQRGTVRFGLLAIKGLGHDVVEEIIKERKEKGEFKDMADFLIRIKGKYVNRKSLESLIRSGAFDRFGDRGEFYYNLERLLDYHKQHEREAASGQFNLFAMGGDAPQTALNLAPSPQLQQKDMLGWEKELLGLYVSEHPFKDYAKRMGNIIIPLGELDQYKQEKKVRVAGIVSTTKRIYTKKKNEPMLFCKLEDGYTDCEVVVFPRVLQESESCWQEENMVMVSGRPSEDGGKMKVLAENVYVITDQNIEQVIAESSIERRATSDEEVAEEVVDKPEEVTVVALKVGSTLPETAIRRLRQIFDANPGSMKVDFVIDDVGGQRKVRSSALIRLAPEVTQQIEEVLGPRTVSF